MDQFKLHILPGNPPPNFIFRKEYNEGYKFYQNTWERIFNRPHRPAFFDPLGFYRQSYIFQISNNSTVIAQTLATHFHLDNLVTEQLPFFECFHGDPLEFLKSENCKSLLSIEYSAVSRENSERKIGLNLYKVLIQLVVNHCKLLDVDAIIGHPRRVTNTNQVIAEIGCKKKSEAVTKYGVSVDIYAGVIEYLIPFDDKDVNLLSEFLWNSRIDTTGITDQFSDSNYNAQYYKPNQITLKKGA
jgi:hypothetical protein